LIYKSKSIRLVFRTGSVCPGPTLLYNGAGLTPDAACANERTMQQVIDVNPSSEHGLYLHLFITNAGGW